jgi:hypothetical protein
MLKSLLVSTAVNLIGISALSLWSYIVNPWSDAWSVFGMMALMAAVFNLIMSVCFYFTPYKRTALSCLINVPVLIIVALCFIRIVHVPGDTYNQNHQGSQDPVIFYSTVTDLAKFLG